MNRISLYEAIRRKKDAEGLKTASQGKDASKQTPPMEPKTHLKPTPAQPAASPIKLMRTRKASLFREQNWFQQAAIAVKKFAQNNSRLAGRIGIAVGVIVVGILIYQSISIERRNKIVAPDNLQAIKQGDNRPAQQKSPVVPARSESVTEKPVEAVKSAASEAPSAKAETAKPAPVVVQKEPVNLDKEKPVGDHIIVIAAYTKENDLLPVQAYFKDNGVETEIVKQGSYYLLVTKNRFENPERNGTDGHRMKQIIKRVGANYKAPDGYERFSSTPFQDAYGKKVK